MKSKIVMGIIIALLVVAVVVEGFVIFKNGKKQEQVELPEQQEEKVEEILKDEELVGEELTITKKYNKPTDNELVYTYLKAEIKDEWSEEWSNASDKIYEDGVIFKYEFNIPQININSNDVKQINKEILDKYETILANVYENQYIDFSAEALDYEYYINDDILSLVLNVYTEGGPIFGSEIYNVDIGTGEKVTNAGLIECMNITKTEFENKLNNAIENLEMYTNKEIEEKFKEEQLNKTLELYKEEVFDEIKMYINKKGNITVSIEVFATAGGEKANCLLDLETGEWLDKTGELQ